MTWVLSPVALSAFHQLAELVPFSFAKVVVWNGFSLRNMKTPPRLMRYTKMSENWVSPVTPKFFQDSECLTDRILS